MVARRGRSHGDDEAACSVGGGGVEADGGEGAAAQGGFGPVEEEAPGRRMRPGRVVPGREGGGVEVEGRRRTCTGAAARGRRGGGVEEEALRWRSGRRRRGSGASRGPAVEGRSEEEERTGHTFYTIEPLAPGENTTRYQNGPKALVGRPPGANGEP